MKNKLFFRILGALASSLIVVSVFVPFIDVASYSTSIWESNQLTNSLYLPIMIIVFGGIGVIFFSLNIKTEFAYMSTGALTFFIAMQTIDILDQGVFNTLGIGYYLLVLGTFLTGIMAFLTNLKTKSKIENTSPVLTSNQQTMFNQIDKSYNSQTLPQNEILSIQPVNNIMEPIPVQPIDSIQSIPIEPIVEAQVPNVAIEQPVEQVPNVVPVQPIPIIEPQSVVQEQPIIQQVTPVVQEFAHRVVNPVVQEFSNTVPINPTVQEFSMPQVNSQQVVEPEVQSVIPQPNPVLNEFTNPSLTAESQQSSGLDIFSQ